MAQIGWLRNAHEDGYDSGDILSTEYSSTRLREEVLAGGSYRDVFDQAVFPFLRPDSVVLELGPGRGSWTRAILEHVPAGRVETVDFVDVGRWLKPDLYGGRLICHHTSDFSLSCVKDESFDFFWSFGVLWHHTIEQIYEILSFARPKMKRGGVAVHQYGDWNKSYQSGRMVHFPNFNDLDDSDDKCWCPSNSARAMAETAKAAGWKVIVPDLNLLRRDGVILLKAW